jgi:hypothetical protein
MRTRPTTRPDDAETVTPIPESLRRRIGEIAKRHGLPTYAVIAVAIDVADRAGVFDDPTLRERYPPRSSSARSWANVSRRVIAAVRRVGPAPIDTIADATRTLSVRQVERAIVNAIEGGSVRRVPGTGLYEAVENPD